MDHFMTGFADELVKLSANLREENPGGVDPNLSSYGKSMAKTLKKVQAPKPGKPQDPGDFVTPTAKRGATINPWTSPNRLAG